MEIECGPETRFQPTVAMLAELDPPVQGVIVASPANPMGTVIPPSELAVIAQWCDAEGAVSDEVYHGLGLSGGRLRCPAPGRPPGNAAVVNSFSKYYDDGLANGWLLVPCRAATAGGPPHRKLHHLSARAASARRAGRLTPEAIAEADGHQAPYAANRETPPPDQVTGITGWRRPTVPLRLR